MAARQRNRGGAQETYSAELTQRQLVLGICVALGLALLSFMAGVTVRLFDPPPEDGEAAGVLEAERPTVAQAEPEDEEEPPTGEGTQVNPTEPEPNAPEPVPPVPVTAPGESQRPPLGITQPNTAVNPLPNRRPVAEREPDVEVTPLPGEESPPATPTIVPPAEPEESVDPPEPQPEEPLVVTPPKLEPMEPPMEEPDPEPAPAPAATGNAGKFGIQIASFQGPERSGDASSYAARVRDKMDRDARVFKSDDDQIHRVLIVGYDTREAADQACEELKKMAGFRDAFIKAL